MLLKYFYDENLAQASYLVGCAKTGEALVVDPARDIQPYLDVAKQEGLQITHVTETHIHADFVSGSRELAAATDASIYLSDMGDKNWKYTYASQPNVLLVTEGDSWMVGNIKVEVVYTPGHTPEHVSFMITDTAGANKPIGVFTGDFLFVGDVGRPDLLEAAAGMMGTADSGARLQFESVKRFKDMPDYLQIWPGHGAGSACGKALGAIPSTTLGYEKLFNPAFQFEDEEEFVSWLLKDQPDAPKYFAQMKKVNKVGPALLDELRTPQIGNRAELNELIEVEALVVDLRNRDAYALNHIPGTVSIPASNSSFTTYIGWYVDYEKPLYLIVPDEDATDAVVEKLRAIGIDNIPGFFGPEVLQDGAERLPSISAADLAERLPRNGLTVLDVRSATEFADGHVAGARNTPVGLLPTFLDELSHDQPLVTLCRSGYRAQVAASYLRSKGFTNAMLMGDPLDTWQSKLTIVKEN